MPITIEDKLIQIQFGVRIKIEKIKPLSFNPYGFLGVDSLQMEQPLFGYKSISMIFLIYNQEGSSSIFLNLR